jgi:hypothetical protein
MKTESRRNAPCSCGSGKRYKACHGRLSDQTADVPPGTSDAYLRHMFLKEEAEERIRQAQQGLGRPIVAVKAGEHQIVAVGNTVHYSRAWKTFPDFLCDYIKKTLDPEWGNAELAKPLAERHPILQWYEAFGRYQRQTIKVPGEVSVATMNGVTACYLGLAYSLYLLAHNVELQERLVRRLKNPGTFQGAYYELLVANMLIRAGFTLTLEDKTDGAAKHCEFSATSKFTGKKYWVEAKMRGVSGLLGKHDKDGAPDTNPISHLIPHLNAALKKPAADERLIFIDLNADATVGAGGHPVWVPRAIERLEQYEAKELPPGVTAYVFVTNMPFHRMLFDDPAMAAVPIGLGIPDFNRPGMIRLSEGYRRRQKHIDAHMIGEALLTYVSLPSTFDGGLPSERHGSPSARLVIGETYFFDNVGERGTIGTVTTAIMMEQEKQVYVGITDHLGRGQILCQPVSDDELADYRAHPDAYFGRILPVSKKITNRYEHFEFLMEGHKSLSRETLLERIAHYPDAAALQDADHGELLAVYCEAMVAAQEAAGFRSVPGAAEERKS